MTGKVLHFNMMHRNGPAVVLLQCFCIGAFFTGQNYAAPLEQLAGDTNIIQDHCECRDQDKPVDCIELAKSAEDNSFLRIQILCNSLSSSKPLHTLYGRLMSVAPQVAPVVTINQLNMKVLPAGFLSGISTHILHMNTTNVLAFDDAVFDGFDTRVLDMKTITPVAPPLEAIRSIPKLGTLMLHGYRVEVIKKGLLSDELKTLGLSSCGVRRIEEDALPEGLILLNLSGNRDLRPENLQDAFKHLSTLRTLMLKETGVHSFTKEMFTGLKNLIALFLVNCNIKQLNDDVFTTLPKLDSLYLGQNALKEFGFLLSTNVSNLNLDDNNLTTLDDEFFKQLAGKDKLRSLNLSNNGFSEVPSALRHLDHLGSLYLSGNHISKLDWSALNGMRSLQLLSIEHNELITIQGKPELPELWSLNLMGNLLESLQGTLKMLQLGALNLAANRIETLDIEELPSTLRRLNLDGNPVHCDNHPEGDFDHVLFEKVAILVRSNHGIPFRDCVQPFVTI